MRYKPFRFLSFVFDLMVFVAAFVLSILILWVFTKYSGFKWLIIIYPLALTATTAMFYAARRQFGPRTTIVQAIFSLLVTFFLFLLLTYLPDSMIFVIILLLIPVIFVTTKHISDHYIARKIKRSEQRMQKH